MLPFSAAQWTIYDFVWSEVSPVFIAGNIRVTEHGSQNRDLFFFNIPSVWCRLLPSWDSDRAKVTVFTTNVSSPRTRTSHFCEPFANPSPLLPHLFNESADTSRHTNLASSASLSQFWNSFFLCLSVKRYVNCYNVYSATGPSAGSILAYFNNFTTRNNLMHLFFLIFVHSFIFCSQIIPVPILGSFPFRFSSVPVVLAVFFYAHFFSVLTLLSFLQQSSCLTSFTLFARGTFLYCLASNGAEACGYKDLPCPPGLARLFRQVTRRAFNSRELDQHFLLAKITAGTWNQSRNTNFK